MNEDLRHLLEKPTTGKAGGLAKKLLKLRIAAAKRRLLLLEALRGRIHRARRWVQADRPCD